MEKFLSKCVPLYLVFGIVSLFLALSFGGFAIFKFQKDGGLPPSSLVRFYDTLGAMPVELAKGVKGALQHRSLVPSRFEKAGLVTNEQVEDSTYGYMLLSRFDITRDQAVVDLVDLATKETAHTWSFNATELWGELDEYPDQGNLQRDKNQQGMRMMHPLALADGSLIFQDHSPLVKISACSGLVWANADFEFHHSLEQDSDGNYWVPSRRFNTPIKMTDFQGNLDYFRDEGVALVSADGKVLSEKNLIEIFEENEMGVYLYGMGYGHLGSRHNDPLHINDIEPVLEDGEFWKRGDIFMSFRHRSMIMLYRPSTNKVIWYKIGPWLHQHDVDIVGPSTILVFNNNAVDPTKPSETFNDVVLYDFATDTVERPYVEGFKDQAIQTFYEGRSQLMDDGRVFVEETNHGRALVIGLDGAVEWQYVNQLEDGAEQTGVLGWSRLVEKDLGSQVVKAVTEAACP